jgi:hypothetical protein
MPSLQPPVSSPSGGGGGYLAPSANNSSLSDRLRVGFGEKSPNLPRGGPHIQVTNYLKIYI